MKSFPHSTMDWDLGGDKFVNHPCEVRIGESELVISYTHLGGRHLWRGTSSDGVNFIVRHDHRPSDTASLTRTDEFTLDGAWIESSTTGNWCIDLDDEP